MATLTLHNGDCLEIMKEIPDASCDLIICDLPYGCLTNQPTADGSNGKSKGGKHYSANKEVKRRVFKRFVDGNETTNTAVYNGGVVAGCSWDVKIDLEAFWKEIKRIRKSDHTPTIHFCTTKFGFELYQSNPDDFRYDLVWDKQRGVSFLSANKFPMRSHEMIYVFSKKGAFYNRVDISGNYPVSKRGKGTVATNVYGATPTYTKESPRDKRCALSVVPIQTKAVAGKHPTEKPVELYRWLIERYCPEEGTVFDPTFGSGNSVFTAFEMGRSAIGIEKDEVFFKKAEERLNAL